MAEPTYRQAGRSSTRSTPQGKTIPVLPPEDTDYLCDHICHCSCNAKLSSNGQVLKQRCVSNSIRRECDAAHQVWKYKGEVGYNMVPYFTRGLPPMPLMSADEPVRPSAFPLGVAMRDGVFTTGDLTGKPQKGLLRIPDVIIVRDMHNFSLEQPNIEFVVEVKFPPDDWRAGQREAYQAIAGDPHRLKEMSPGLCKCRPCEQREKQPATVTLPQDRTAEDKTRQLREIREHNAYVDAHPMPYLYDKYREPTPLADYLKTGAKVLGVIAVTFVVTAVAPEALPLLLVVARTATP